MSTSVGHHNMALFSSEKIRKLGGLPGAKILVIVPKGWKSGVLSSKTKKFGLRKEDFSRELLADWKRILRQQQERKINTTSVQVHTLVHQVGVLGHNFQFTPPITTLLLEETVYSPVKGPTIFLPKNVPAFLIQFVSFRREIFCNWDAWVLFIKHHLLRAIWCESDDHEALLTVLTFP